MTNMSNSGIASSEINDTPVPPSNTYKGQVVQSIDEMDIEKVWEVVQLARHPDRPTTLEYIDQMSEQFIELHGDRYAGDDKALVGGVCTINGIHFSFIGNQKGANMKENIERNYGMAHPEGYRKALRIAKQAEHFERPLLSFIDTSGAYPGLASEERGIGEAIAKNLLEFSMLKIPIICIIIGEGGSGGALGIGIGDRIYMLENSVYSVISPEGFASILLRDAKRSKEAAHLMKMTAGHVFQNGFIDKVIPEPEGGAHTDFIQMADIIKTTILQSYDELRAHDINTLLKNRSETIINWTRSLDNKETAVQKGFFGKIKNLFDLT